MRVFVLLFNARTENEGIHTIRIGEQNVVLMFEQEDDALRFAGLLEAQDFPLASVEAFDQEEIEDFCLGAGYEAKLITPETMVMPPAQNVETTEWQPEGAADPNPSPGPTSDLAAAELDRIRQQLENLL